ncbi:hypothetical protein [Methanosarcina sp. UBA5]|uniref:hypothetical protein n=1 Tax=Methanosarcina sp. UBA5 TaxID=1915593 RepID=UPI0025CC1EEF|nr:hypothetical protein [Methanosarcina sp. UBA5]
MNPYFLRLKAVLHFAEHVSFFEFEVSKVSPQFLQIFSIMPLRSRASPGVLAGFSVGTWAFTLISSVLASNRLYSNLGMPWDVMGYLQGKRLLHCVRRCESMLYIHTDTLLHILCSGLMLMIYHIYMWYISFIVVYMHV